MAAESQALAWLFRAANERYATDYPATVGNRMQSTDSVPFQDDVAAISLRENERGAQIGTRLGSALAPADRRLRDVQRQGFPARAQRRADDAGGDRAARGCDDRRGEGRSSKVKPQRSRKAEAGS